MGVEQTNGNGGVLALVLKIGVIVVGGLLTTGNVALVKAVINHSETIAVLQTLVANQEKRSEEIRREQEKTNASLTRIIDHLLAHK